MEKINVYYSRKEWQTPLKVQTSGKVQPPVKAQTPVQVETAGKVEPPPVKAQTPPVQVETAGKVEPPPVKAQTPPVKAQTPVQVQTDQSTPQIRNQRIRKVNVKMKIVY